ncbi:MAG: GDP-mannose 4,6-dehydratase, partial [Pseudomonadales bacterium]
MKVLVTGAAGFIGSTLSHKLLARGDTVIGIDNLNDYYEVSLKEARLARLTHNNFDFHRADICDAGGLKEVFDKTRPDRIVHLAAQAGVRYSLENPQAYIDTNVT